MKWTEFDETINQMTGEHDQNKTEWCRYMVIYTWI